MIDYTPPPDVHWPTVLTEIWSAKKCMTLARIAREAGIAPQTLTEIVHGRTKEPRYSTGARLMALRDQLGK